MDQLIPVINRLQEVFHAIGGEVIQLPQIVVVGVQSSGKTSVLENIIGRDFLPRGQGIVTRRPLILQLINLSTRPTPVFPEDRCRESVVSSPEHSSEIEEHTEGAQADANQNEFAVFHHAREKRFYSDDDIRAEIIRQTEKVAGSNKGVSSEPIMMKIYSPKVINLSLVDLPGITKVPVGDQPVDIELQIRHMVLQYIKNPNVIILAVTAANTDMAASESLKLAREVDPDGNRTLAVMSKIDLLDRGTDAFELLNGKVVPVKLGIIGIMCRNQVDINCGKTIEEALEDEHDFFRINYPILSHRNGTVYLIRTLNKLLVDHIIKCLPDLRTRVQGLLLHYQQLMASYGEYVENKPLFVLGLLTNFSDTYRHTLEGTLNSVFKNELYGGARICYVLHEVFTKAVAETEAGNKVSFKEILTTIRNASGTRPSIFVPQVSFEILVQRQIKKLEAPSLRCVALVFEEMQRIISTAIKQVAVIQRFPVLQEKVLSVAHNLLTTRLSPSNQMVQNLITMELSYINTNHPHFIRDVYDMFVSDHAENSIVSSVIAKKNGMSNFDSAMLDGTSVDGEVLQMVKEMSDKEKQDCEMLQRLVRSYLHIVKTTIQDTVPKAIMYFLVNYVSSHIQSELVEMLYREKDLDHLLVESEALTAKRERTQVLIKALKNALGIISEVRDGNWA